MNTNEEAKLVIAWIELHHSERGTSRYDELFWSWDALWELTVNEPEVAWDVILTILHSDRSSDIMETLSAGPLEDLLAKHGPEFIERIEGKAATDLHFRRLLGGVWKNAMTDEIWRRVQACRERRGWDGIPE